MVHDTRILVVDDEAAQRDAVAGFLRKQGYDILTANGVTETRAVLDAHTPSLILTDFMMGDGSGLDIVTQVRATLPDIPVIVMTAYGSVENAVEVMRAGAFDYLQKPIDLQELLFVIRRAEERFLLLSENRLLRRQLQEKHSFAGIVSQSGEMEQVLSLAARVAQSKASVLIRGESGTGKELVAHAVHAASARSGKPFVVVNCAAIPESLFESELFGHEKGAFTGAERPRQGIFEQADSGTLFIDEVGDIPLPVQVKLLRALQSGEIQRLGADAVTRVDVRVVAATHRDLEQMMRDGAFREDLYYRLNVVSVRIPPLRERRQDILPLAEHFLGRYAEENGKKVDGLSREAADILLRHSFPGNVRELENLIQRAVVLSRGELITTRDFPSSLHDREPHGDAPRVEPSDLPLAVEQLEQSMIASALERTEGNQVKAAELLNISERMLRYKLSKYRK